MPPAPEDVRAPAAITAPGLVDAAADDLKRITSTGVFWTVAAALAPEVWKIMSPPKTAPVDLEPIIVQFWPTVDVVPATTL